ncbi:hypothetical protein ACE6H2_020242 [Prunus campanulata]
MNIVHNDIGGYRCTCSKISLKVTVVLSRKGGSANGVRGLTMSDGIAMGENLGLGCDCEAEKTIPGYCRSTTWMAKSFRHGTMGWIGRYDHGTMRMVARHCTVVLARCHTARMAWTPEDLGSLAALNEIS